MSLARRKPVAPPLPECPLNSCIALLGGVWTPNVIWSLSGGARRFSELRSDIPTISAKVLSTRLRSLEEKGVVTRFVVPSSPPSVEYSLTDLGLELMPVIESIAQVAARLRRRRRLASA